jgi:amino acid transporter
MPIPDGGGAYVVARDNLGEMAGLIAASSLLTDYILTVSVSISSGVAQIVSAYPVLYEYRVVLAVAAVFLVTCSSTCAACVNPVRPLLCQVCRLSSSCSSCDRCRHVQIFFGHAGHGG